MLERLKKLESVVRYYVAKNKNDQDSIISAKEWQLVYHIILLLEPFFSKKQSIALKRDPACKITDEVC